MLVVVVAAALASAMGFSSWVRQGENISLTETESNVSGTEKVNAVANYGAIPLHFEPNVGQAAAPVRFLARGSGYSLFLTSDGAVLALEKAKPGMQNSKADVLRMEIAGANLSAETTGENLLEGKTNYIRGSDPGKWKTDIANFERVRYLNIYDGVDVVYYGAGQQLEYDFVVNPNADPRTIGLEFKGAKRIKINALGELILRTNGGEIHQHKPNVYQEAAGERKTIDGRYVITGKNRIGFAVADYDRSLPLIIDPVLSYSTYLGGSNETRGTSIAVDASGSAYITGNTTALDFPTVNPFQSANRGGQEGFVTKLNPAGTAFVYSTYLGGTSNDLPTSIKVDAAGSAFVAGFTLSSDFPTTPGAYQRNGGARSGFITKLSPNGSSLVYSTYLSSPITFAGVDELSGLAIDSSGNAYVTGGTTEPTFPTTPGAFKTTLAGFGSENAFVTKLNPAGSALVYSTFVGFDTPVNGVAPTDYATAIAVDSTGNAYITGQTRSANFPVTGGAFQNLPGSSRDAFVTKLNANGTALVYSTYLGGISDESGTGIAVDAASNAYVTGDYRGTADSDFPFTPNSFLPSGNASFGIHAFLTKLNPSGTALIYSTTLALKQTFGSGVALDSTGSAYVIGSEQIGAAFPINAVQPVSRNIDAFIVKMNSAGTALTYSTSFGGGNATTTGSAIALDASGNAYITGYTNSSDFPITASAPQSTKPGGQLGTAFVARIGVRVNDCPAITIDPQPLPSAIFNRSFTQRLTASGGTAPYTFSLAPSSGGDNLPTGLTLAADGTISGTPTATNFSTYQVTVQAVDSNGCIGIRTLQLLLDGFDPRFFGLYLKIVARPVIRIGNEYNFFVTVANRTATTATNVPLIIRFPNYVRLRLKYDQSIQPFVTGDYSYFVLTLPRLPAMSDLMQLPISVKVSDADRDNQQFAVEAFFPKFALPPTPIGSPEPLPFIDDKPSSGINFSVSDSHRPLTASELDFIVLENAPYNQSRPTWEEAYAYAVLVGDKDLTNSPKVTPKKSNDPNEKSGSEGAGPEHFYTGDVTLPYIVTFENKDTASLPAQDVVVTDQLDPNVFDLSTFSFNTIEFGAKQVAPVSGVKQFTTDVDLRPAKQAIVRVNGNVNTSTGLVTWRFNTLDPATGLPPDDPQAGFLPPNRTSPEGQGTLFFTVKAKQGLPTGTQIKNKARIVFDVNAPIDTPEWLNTIDNSKPSSRVQALPANSSYSIPLSWSGTDIGSGVANYTIYVSEDGGAFVPYLTDTAKTSVVFTALKANHTFSFYSIARDAAGNAEPAKTSAETITTVNLVPVSGRVLTPDGRGLRNAIVSITDPNGVRRTATTSSFGFFQFDNVLIGRSYTVSVLSRLYRFAPQLIQVNDNLTLPDFIGLE